MKSAKLDWQVGSNGIDFKMLDESQAPINIDLWGLYDVVIGKEQGSVGSLLSLYNDGKVESLDGTVHLSHSQVANLDSAELAQLGLPPAAPFRLQVRGKGQIARSGFSLDCKLLTDKGRPTLGLERKGTYCTFAGKQFMLLDPLFELLRGIELFQESTFSSVDDQMVTWGKLKELLPEDAVVDNQLKTVNIVRAEKFTLDIHENDEFSPVLLHENKSEDGLSEEPTSVLPEARRESFADQFKRRPQARQHYALGAGWYAVVPEKLQKALQAVRTAQDRDRAGRKAFLANPMAEVREALLQDNFSPDQEEEVENIFIETKEFLSERIISLGEWEPKLCAYRLPIKNKWLPEEDILYNVVIGDSTVTITPKEVEEVLPKLEEALQNNASEVEVGGKKYPVNDVIVEAFKRLVPKEKSEANEKKYPSPVQAPILKDNIEEEDFVALQRNERGKPGGLPANLKTCPLFEHQQKGLSWLQEHWAQGATGVLLADDMGLGKTLQALSFMAWVSELMANDLYSKKPFLVVAPTGLLKNWQDEADKHLDSPGLGMVFEAFGTKLSAFKSMTLWQRREAFQESDWVLTTYETLRDKIQYFLPVEWGITVFDEAQKIKNPVSRMTEMAKSLESDFTVILTGTPVENELKDLWCIIDVAAPGFLGSLNQFHDMYAKPAQSDPEYAVMLQNKLLKETNPPIMLRRMKEDYLDGLPKKEIIVQKEAMPSLQADNYSAIVRQAANEKGRQGAMLKALQQMRSCSLFPSEIDNEGLSDKKVAESARLSAAIKTLDSVHGKGEKALIFLESLKLQELLIPFLQKRYGMPRPPLRISGKDKGLLRKKHVDTFQGTEEGVFDVMILSPKAGGVGLTLTAANHLIHLTRWWNPAVEDQCTDRIFRIGQQKPVFIYYPLAVHPQFGNNSFDINLHKLLEQKRKLSRSVLMPNFITSADYQDLFDKSVS